MISWDNYKNLRERIPNRQILGLLCINFLYYAVAKCIGLKYGAEFSDQHSKIGDRTATKYTMHAYSGFFFASTYSPLSSFSPYDFLYMVVCRRYTTAIPTRFRKGPLIKFLFCSI